MPIHMGLAALLMSGAMQSGEPATKLTLGTDAISQPNGGAAVILAAGSTGTSKKMEKKGKKQKSFLPKKD